MSGRGYGGVGWAIMGGSERVGLGRTGRNAVSRLEMKTPIPPILILSRASRRHLKSLPLRLQREPLPKSPVHRGHCAKHLHALSSRRTPSYKVNLSSEGVLLYSACPGFRAQVQLNSLRRK